MVWSWYNTLSVGDHSKYIEIHLYDEDEFDNTTPTDITGASIFIYWRKANETTNSVSGSTAEVVTGTLGHCRYLVNSADVTRSGDFIGEIKIKASDGGITTWRNWYIDIEESIGTIS